MKHYINCIKDVTYENFYKTLIESKEELSNINHLKNFNSFWEHDYVTGEECAADLLKILAKQKINKGKKAYYDDFELLILYSIKPSEKIMEDLHTKIVREHLLLPLHALRETDERTINWLGQKPGVTLREKLGGKNRIFAPKRQNSVDTQENRIFKAYLQKLNLILLLWEKIYLNPDAENPYSKKNYALIKSFAIKIRKWLKSEDAELIHSPQSYLPNNTMIGNRNYKKIWRGWGKFSGINTRLLNFYKNINSYRTVSEYFSTAKKLHEDFGYDFYPQPVFCNKADADEKENFFPVFQLPFTKTDKEAQLDFCGTFNDESGKNNFRLVSKANLLEFYVFNNESKNWEKREIPKTQLTVKPKRADKTKDSETAAIDCVSENIEYSTIKNPKESRDSKHKWLNGQIFDPNMLYGKARIQVWKDEGGNFYPIPGFYGFYNSEYIAKEYRNNLITIGMGDLFNLKEDSPVYPYAPVAARYFAQFFRGIFKGARYFYYVVPDSADDFADDPFTEAMTENFGQAEPLPRSIAAVFTIMCHKYRGQEIKLNFGSVIRCEEIVSGGKIVVDVKVDKKPDDKKFTRLKEAKVPGGFTLERMPPEFVPEGQKASAVNYKITQAITLKPEDKFSQGAIYFAKWQKSVPDIMLWRNHLPELTMSSLDDSVKVKLVDSEVSIPMVKGKPVEIKCASVKNQQIQLFSGHKYAQFKLAIGKNKEESKHFAYVSSEQMPFKNEVLCNLRLTYTYGKPHPYELFFEPVNKAAGINTIQVEWCKEARKEEENYQALEFYREDSWEEARKKRSQKGEFFYNEFCIVYQKFNMYLNLKNCAGNLNLTKADIVPIISLWDQGRNLSQDTANSSGEKDKISVIQNGALSVFKNERENFESRNCAFWLILAFHEDCPEVFGKHLADILKKAAAENGEEIFDAPGYGNALKAAGYAVGNCKYEWQRSVLKSLIKLCTKNNKYYSEQAFIALGTALWRTRNCINYLEYEDVKKLKELSVKKISEFLKKYEKSGENFDSGVYKTRINFLRSIETILCLYRFRGFRDAKYEKIRSLVSTKEMSALEKLFPQMEDFCRYDLESKDGMVTGVKDKVYKPLYSRIQFDIDDSAWNKKITPDYLFVLEKYSKGDVSGIKILGVED